VPVSPRLLTLGVLVIGISPSRTRADDTDSSVAVEPLPRVSYLRIEPIYSRHRQELDLRGVFVQAGPMLGEEQLVLGVGGEVVAMREGLGDLGVTTVVGVRTHGFLFGTGLALELPTATSQALGLGAVRIGPAWFVQSSVTSWLDLSLLARSYFLTAHTQDRTNAFSTKLEPGIAVTLPADLVLSSSGEIEVDWFAESGVVPVNLELSYPFGRNVLVTCGPEVVVAGRGQGTVRLDLQIDILDQ
jgi:hypothetical protein